MCGTGSGRGHWNEEWSVGSPISMRWLWDRKTQHHYKVRAGAMQKKIKNPMPQGKSWYTVLATQRCVSLPTGKVREHGLPPMQRGIVGRNRKPSPGGSYRGKGVTEHLCFILF